MYWRHFNYHAIKFPPYCFSINEPGFTFQRTVVHQSIGHRSIYENVFLPHPSRHPKFPERKHWRTKVHFVAVQGLLNKVSKVYYCSIKENGLIVMFKKWPSKEKGCYRFCGTARVISNNILIDWKFDMHIWSSCICRSMKEVLIWHCSHCPIT